MAGRLVLSVASKVLLVVLLVQWPHFTAASKARARTNRREQGVTTGVASTLSQATASVLAPADSLSKLMFIKDLANGVDPYKVMSDVVGGGGLQKLMQSPTVMQKVVEANPLLKSIDGFEKVATGGLDANGMAKAFQAGLKDLMDVAKTAQVISKDPSGMSSAAGQVLSSTDEATQTLLAQARAGNETAMTEVQALVSQNLVPGVDYKKMKAVTDAQNFDQILKNKDMMFYIDQDKTMSEVFRQGKVLPSYPAEKRRLSLADDRLT